MEKGVGAPPPPHRLVLSEAEGRVEWIPPLARVAHSVGMTEEGTPPACPGLSSRVSFFFCHPERRWSGSDAVVEGSPEAWDSRRSALSGEVGGNGHDVRLVGREYDAALVFIAIDCIIRRSGDNKNATLIGVTDYPIHQHA